MASNAKIIGDLIAADASVAIPGDGVILASDLADGSVTTAKLADANVTVDKIATTVPLGTKNMIINGDMRIAQRGNNVTGITASGYHSIDRWYTRLNTLGTWTQSQDTDVPTGQGFAYSLKMDCTTADASPAAGDYLFLQYKIEGQNLQHLKWGTSSAEDLTLSFWIKSNKTGTYQLTPTVIGSSTAGYTLSYTIDSADTWEKKTITIPKTTSITMDSDNVTRIQLELCLGAGSDFAGGSDMTWTTFTNNARAKDQTVNLADSTSNYINITGVQLEVGDTATSFEHRPYDMELARCQRYYFRLNPNNIRYGMISPTAYTRSSTTVDLAVSFPVTMRDKPSSVSFDSIVFRRYDGSLVGGSFSALSLDTNTITPYNALLNATVSAGTAGHTGSVICNNNVNGYLAIESEL